MIPEGMKRGSYGLYDRETFIRDQTKRWFTMEHEYAGVAIGLRALVDEWIVPQFGPDTKILDVPCGDGVLLKELQARGYRDLTGKELSEKKIAEARKLGIEILREDFHNLSNGLYDLVFCTHGLEHAFEPAEVMDGLLRSMSRNAHLVITVPYPETSGSDAHLAAHEIGIDQKDQGATFIAWVKSFGLRCINTKFADQREAEIWTMFR